MARTGRTHGTLLGNAPGEMPDPIVSVPSPNPATSKWSVLRRARAQTTFLEAFARLGNITYAARAAGVGRAIIYVWLEADETFAAAFRAAETEALETLEREAWRRAVEGTPYERTSYWHGEPVGTDRKIEYSDQLLILLLRARAPEKYRDKVDLAGVREVIKAIGGLDPASVL